MGKSVKLVVLLGGVVAVVASVALAMTGDQGAPVVTPHKKICLMVNAGDPVKLDLEDLKDSESRTIKNGDRELVVTRKGDEIQVTSVGEDGTRRVIIDTTQIEGGDGHVCRIQGRDGEKARRVIIRTAGKGEDGQPIVIGTGEAGEKEIVVKKLCLLGDDKETLELDTDVAGAACHLDAAEAMSTYRCKDDEAMVTLPKAKEPHVAPACPVCGKLMDKVTAHQIVVRATIDDSPEEK